MTNPSTGQVHVRLVPVFQALLDSRRPQTTIGWLRRAPGHGPRLLAQMARGQIEISHDTFRRLPSDRAHNYLRGLLAAAGVLEPYDDQLERIAPWLNQILQGLPKQHADILSRYANWHVLRFLRSHAANGPLGRSRVLGWRSRINAAVRFLAWTTEQGTTLADLTQGQLEQYLAAHPGAVNTVYSFLTWVRKTGLNPRIRVAAVESPAPQVTVSDEDRWRQVEQLLHEEEIRLYARIGGLFMLLFARPLAGICLMKTDQVTFADDGRVLVRFDQVPVEMPEPLDQLLRDHMSRPGGPSTVARDGGWLFPGRIPATPLATENIRGELVAHGIHPGRSRNAAMFALAGTVPAPVLADLIAIAPKTAVRWAALAARDWSQYAAVRTSN